MLPNNHSLILKLIRQHFRLQTRIKPGYALRVVEEGIRCVRFSLYKIFLKVVVLTGFGPRNRLLYAQVILNENYIAIIHANNSESF